MQDQDKKQRPTIGLIEHPADPKAFRESVLGVHPLEQAARERGLTLDDAIAIVKKRKDLRDYELEFLNSIAVQGFVNAVEQLNLITTASTNEGNRIDASKALITTYLKLKEIQGGPKETQKDPFTRAVGEASLWTFTAVK